MTTILVGIIFVITNVLRLDGARTFAGQSVNGLKKLERAVSNIKSFRQENGRYPTSLEINCTNYKAITVENDICIQTVFLRMLEEEHNFIVTYKSLGVPFSGKMGSGLKREYIYNTKTQSFNYSHLDTYPEVVFWRLRKVLIGLLLIFLPLVYLRSSGRRKDS